MRRRYMIGTVMAGSALLAACGSTSTQSLKPTPAPTAKKSTTTTSATTSEYLNIYQGIPNSPVSSNGYPFSVPDSMRILAPSLLKKEVLDTKLPKIGVTYVGTTWTPAQRMEIYTAKMYMLYSFTFGLPQYLTTNTKTFHDVARMFVPFYGSLAAVNKQMVTTGSDGLAIFQGDIKGQSESGVHTLVQPFLDAANISLSTYQGSPEVQFAIPKGSFAVKTTSPSAPASIITGLSNSVLIQPQPNEWTNVWPVTGSGFTPN
ncbi:hypothetical protein [Ferrimicrobium sp.]|uniref:hypothetical protein n=1 Tax=Ferrimicrobium sp. TaxID=2926050 RepID=UPI00260A7270|nr:hypothetical protein [Ferrimicrobium sp.]